MIIPSDDSDTPEQEEATMNYPPHAAAGVLCLPSHSHSDQEQPLMHQPEERSWGEHPKCVVHRRAAAVPSPVAAAGVPPVVAAVHLHWHHNTRSWDILVAAVLVGMRVGSRRMRFGAGGFGGGLASGGMRVVVDPFSFGAGRGSGRR